MKKLCAAFAVIMTIATVLLLWSCGSEIKNVSERRSGYFTAGDDVFTLTAVSGERENPFAADGKAGPLMPYTLITVVPSEFDVDAIITYSAKTASSGYGGTMTVHPFAASFSAELDAELIGAFTVTVTVGGVAHEYEMKSSVTPDMISFSEAVGIAEDRLEPVGAYEVRGRLIKNPLDGDGLCWHIAFIFGAEKEHSVLLDPVTGKVLAKKN